MSEITNRCLSLSLSLKKLIYKKIKYCSMINPQFTYSKKIQSLLFDFLFHLWDLTSHTGKKYFVFSPKDVEHRKELKT